MLLTWMVKSDAACEGSFAEETLKLDATCEGSSVQEILELDDAESGETCFGWAVSSMSLSQWDRIVLRCCEACGDYTCDTPLPC